MSSCAECKEALTSAGLCPAGHSSPDQLVREIADKLGTTKPDEKPDTIMITGAALARLGMEAMRALHEAEETYLLVFGWTKLRNGMWSAPPDHQRSCRREYEHSHAVNSQKSQTITSLRKRGRLPENMTHDDQYNWTPKKGASGVDFTNAAHRVCVCGDPKCSVCWERLAKAKH